MFDLMNILFPIKTDRGENCAGVGGGADVDAFADGDIDGARDGDSKNCELVLGLPLEQDGVDDGDGEAADVDALLVAVTFGAAADGD